MSFLITFGKRSHSFRSENDIANYDLANNKFDVVLENLYYSHERMCDKTVEKVKLEKEVTLLLNEEA